MRELRNVLERAAILCDGDLISSAHLSLPVPSPSPTKLVLNEAAASGAVAGPPSSAGELRTMERTLIEEALVQARFNKSRAAKAVGLTRRQLYVRMQRYGLQ